MNKEQANNIKVGTRLININTCSVGKLTFLHDTSSYRYRIYEKTKEDSYWWDNLDDWYTKEQLKDILVSTLQAMNLLQSDDFFDIDDKFINIKDDNLIYVTKDNCEKRIFVNTGGEFFLDYNDKCMKFVPYTKPFTKKDLKNGMKVKTECGLEGIILLNTPVGNVIKYEDTFTPLSYYNNSLESYLRPNINKVYTLSEEGESYNYKLLWERN